MVPFWVVLPAIIFVGASSRVAPLGAAEPVPTTKPVVIRDTDRDLVSIRVPSQRDGMVLVIGTELREGEKVPADRLFTVKVGGSERKYRRLVPGDHVQEGQILAQLDDRLARLDMGIAQAKVRACEAELRRAEAVQTIYRGELDRLDKIIQTAGRNAVSAHEYARVKEELDKAALEGTGKKEAIAVARLELQKAQIVLETYTVRSPARGILGRITRRPGEAIRQWQTLLYIEVKSR
jgi:biotin carboxyl carrier protein